MQTERARLDNIIDTLGESEMARPALDGGWSVKDALAHITVWEQRFIGADHEVAGSVDHETAAGSDEVAATPGFFEQVCGVELPHRRANRAGFEAIEIEDVAQEVIQAIGLGIDRIEELHEV